MHYNPSGWEAEVAGLGAQIYPGLNREFQVSLGLLERFCLKYKLIS